LIARRIDCHQPYKLRDSRACSEQNSALRKDFLTSAIERRFIASTGDNRMVSEQDILLDELWLAVGLEQRRAMQGLIKATGEAESFIKSRLAEAQGSMSETGLKDILRWTELCRDLGVLPK
jgi:hypothetical protein